MQCFGLEMSYNIMIEGCDGEVAELMAVRRHTKNKKKGLAIRHMPCKYDPLTTSSNQVPPTGFHHFPIISPN